MIGVVVGVVMALPTPLPSTVEPSVFSEER